MYTKNFTSWKRNTYSSNRS